MLYRIDREHFLTHAIDYFTRDELIHLIYVIISPSIANTAKSNNVIKCINLYPTTNIIDAYEEYKDKKIMEEMYIDLLTIKSPEDEWVGNLIYKNIVNPVLSHNDIVLMCTRDENVYMDVLCKHLKKHYALDCINLNTLFSEGRVGSIYIDRSAIWDKAVDIRRASGKAQIASLETTKDGRMSLLQKMTKKHKIEKLKELGIKISDKDKSELDKLLVEAWVEDEEGG